MSNYQRLVAETPISTAQRIQAACTEQAFSGRFGISLAVTELYFQDAFWTRNAANQPQLLAISQHQERR